MYAPEDRGRGSDPPLGATPPSHSPFPTPLLFAKLPGVHAGEAFAKLKLLHATPPSRVRYFS